MKCQSCMNRLELGEGKSLNYIGEPVMVVCDSCDEHAKDMELKKYNAYKKKNSVFFTRVKKKLLGIIFPNV